MPLLLDVPCSCPPHGNSNLSQMNANTNRFDGGAQIRGPEARTSPRCQNQRLQASSPESEAAVHRRPTDQRQLTSEIKPGQGDSRVGSDCGRLLITELQWLHWPWPLAHARTRSFVSKKRNEQLSDRDVLCLVSLCLVLKSVSFWWHKTIQQNMFSFFY